MTTLGRGSLSLSLWLAGLALTGCTAEISGTEGAEYGPPQVVGLEHKRALDLLFVIDNSGSMAQEQEALASGFNRFAETLKGPDGALPDLHIGVISTSVFTGTGGGGGPACADAPEDIGLIVRPECQVLNDGSAFISDIATQSGEREINYAGELAEQFGCMTQLGIGGCGFEQPFEAMKRALENTDLNGDFLRPEADLAVVILSDEDDCSASDYGIFDPSQDSIDSPLGELSSFRCFEFGVQCAGDAEGGERTIGPRSDCVAATESPYIEPVQTYVDFLKGLKGNQDQVFVATITADSSPVKVSIDPEKDERWVEPSCVICPGGSAVGCSLNPNEVGAALVAASPAIRMNALVDGFGDNGYRQDICSYDPVTDSLDFGSSLGHVADQIAPRLDTTCLAADPIDMDAEIPGVQASCTLADVSPGDGGAAVESAIAACGESVAGQPCFRLDPNASQCTGTASHLELTVEREGAAPAGSHLSLQCVTTLVSEDAP